MSSNLYKIGTIYSRVNGLLRKNAMNKEDAPIWYDVYSRFPPKYEPSYGRKAPEEEIPEIFYPEDKLRAQLHTQFSTYLGTINLEKQGETNCQKWINKYKIYMAEGVSHNDAMKKLSEFIKSSTSVTEFSKKPSREKSDISKIDFVEIMEEQTSDNTNIKSENPNQS